MKMASMGLSTIVALTIAGFANAQITGAGVPAGAEARTGAAQQPIGQPEATRLAQPQLDLEQSPDIRLQEQVEEARLQQEALQQPDELRRQQLLQPGVPGAAPDPAARAALGVFTVASAGPGVEITRVSPGSAAEQAGLRPRDVILQIDDRGVMSPMDVQRTIRQMPVGQTATLQIWRDGTTEEVPVTLGPARDPARPPVGVAPRDPYGVGFRAEAPATADAAALEQRTIRLEQQFTQVMQELQMLRQQMTQLQDQLAQRPATPDAPPPREPVREPAPPRVEEVPADLDFDLFGNVPADEPTPPEPEDEQPPAEQPPEEEPFDF